MLQARCPTYVAVFNYSTHNILYLTRSCHCNCQTWLAEACHWHSNDLCVQILEELLGIASKQKFCWFRICDSLSYTTVPYVTFENILWPKSTCIVVYETEVHNGASMQHRNTSDCPELALRKLILRSYAAHFFSAASRVMAACQTSRVSSSSSSSSSFLPGLLYRSKVTTSTFAGAEFRNSTGSHAAPWLSISSRSEFL